MSKKYDPYLRAKPFFEEVVQCILDDEPSETLAITFRKLAEKNFSHHRFNNYDFLKEDMVSSATLVCLERFRTFTALRDKSWTRDYMPEYHHLTCFSAFSYFTSFVINDFKKFLKEYYNHKNKVNKIKIENGLEPDHGYLDAMEQKQKREQENE